MSLRRIVSAILALVMVSFGTQSALGTVQADNHMQVVATGLDNPRGLAFGPDGSLWVAESGRGGPGPCFPGPEGEACLGSSGAVTRIANGRQQRVVTGLPSLAAPDGTAAIGPSDVAPHAQGVDAIIGLGADPAVRAGLGQAGRYLGHLIHIMPNGQWMSEADVAGYETTDNPEPSAVDSNPYSVIRVSGGNVVADAGGNDLLWVDDDGSIQAIAIFPNRPVMPPPFLDLPPGAMIPMNAVPTTVRMGPDGAYYVGQLTGFPFPQGGANVYRVVPGEAPEIVAEGFTNIIGIDFGPDGSMYVLEIATNSLLTASEENPPVGALWRVWPSGSVTLVASEGLIAPGGLAVAGDGSVYVSNFSILPGLGQIVRITQGGGGKGSRK